MNIFFNIFLFMIFLLTSKVSYASDRIINDCEDFNYSIPTVFLSLQQDNISFFYQYPRKLTMWLDVKDIGKIAQVSKKFSDIFKQNFVWQEAGSRIYSDWFSFDDLRLDARNLVIKHHLYISIHKEDCLKSKRDLLKKYQLRESISSFKNYINIDLLISPVFDHLNNLEKKELVIQGVPYAITCKIEKLCQINIQKARYFIDYLLENNNLIGAKWKLEGIIHGLNGYNQLMPSEQKNLIDIWDEENVPISFQYKLEGLLEGKYGYLKNTNLAKEFIEKKIQQGNLEANIWKWTAIINKSYDYNFSSEQIKLLIESQIRKGNTSAYIIKNLSLLEGKNSYPQDIEQARGIIEEAIGLGYKQAYRWKIDGLYSGKYGYYEDGEELKAFINSCLEIGDPNIINYNFELLLYHGCYEELQKFIQFLIESKYCYYRGTGHYIKTFCLKYGLCNFKKNKIEARKYIELFSVPF